MAKKNKILVVDDNEALCNMIKDILEMENYEVSTALDGFKALELVKQETFDSVLMDIKMPVMNGVETFKKLKEIAPKTPVIMVTAYAVEDLIGEALREGAFAALHKPIDFEQLFETIDCATPDGGLVLVVDDEKDFCTTLQHVLKQKGYRVSVAYDGEAAIRKTRENNFDIIICDMRLPTLNGLNTYLAIREIRPYATVILISGHSEEKESLTTMAVEENAYICLEKPLNMDEFLPMLNEIMEKKRGGAATSDPTSLQS